MGYEIYCDGLCEPCNPGGTACWGFVVLKDGKKIHEDCGVVGTGESMTNNLAEYNSLLNALAWSYKQKVSPKFYMDSQLVVNQVNGNWKCNKEHLIQLRDRCAKGIRLIESTLEWVPREKNESADKLSQKAYANRNVLKPTRV